MDDQRIRAIMSGDARDLSARLLRVLTLPASWLFAVLARLRLALFALGIKRQERVDCPVICVGNLSTGGTGKTPMVVWLAQHLIAQGHTPGILSRGYRAASIEEASDQRGNDEARMLAELLPNTLHIENPDRVAGAHSLIEQGCDVVLLDDGFSHLRLARDLDILLFDALCPFGYGHMLPRGMLREPRKSSKRAGFSVITRSDQINESALAKLQAQLAKLGQTQIALAQHAPSELLSLSDPSERLDLSELQGKRVAQLCAIGNPQGFAATLQASGAEVVSAALLPDHFSYNDAWLKRDWPSIAALAQAANAELIVTTQKDAVKLRGRLAHEVLPAYELRIAMQLDPAGEAALKAKVIDTIEAWQRATHKAD